MADFIDSRAEVGSDEESNFDSETGDRRDRTNGKNRADVDSSEEEESDDEEAAREVRGYLVFWSCY